jgi:hypothetical protein
VIENDLSLSGVAMFGGARVSNVAPSRNQLLKESPFIELAQ